MRKSKTVVINDRDREITFNIKEMGALGSERWKFKAIMLLLNGNIKLPEGVNIEDGINYLMKGGADNLVKALASINEEKALALFDEMLTSCVEIDKGGVKEKLTPELIDANISDSMTITKLRWELLKLHFDFLDKGGVLPFQEKQHIKLNVEKTA